MKKGSPKGVSSYMTLHSVFGFHVKAGFTCSLFASAPSICLRTELATEVQRGHAASCAVRSFTGAIVDTSCNFLKLRCCSPFGV